ICLLESALERLTHRTSRQCHAITEADSAIHHEDADIFNEAIVLQTVITDHDVRIKLCRTLDRSKTRLSYDSRSYLSKQERFIAYSTHAWLNDGWLDDVCTV